MWFIGILKKFIGILTNIAQSIMKSINNRFKNEDGKIAEVSTIKKIFKIVLILLVIGIAFRMLTNHEDMSIYDKYNTENKTPFQTARQIGDDANAQDRKNSISRDLETNNNLGRNESSSGPFSLSPGEANKFSCSEAIKKIQRGDALDKSERNLFKNCLDQNLTETPTIVSNIYPKIANADAPLDSNKAKNAVDTVEGTDEKAKELLGIANKGIGAPTGSQEQEMSEKILEWLPSFSKEVKEKTIELANKGDAENASKLIENEQKATPTKVLVDQNISSNDQGNTANQNEGSKLSQSEDKIDKESSAERRANIDEAAKLNQEKIKDLAELDSLQKELKAYNLPDEKTKEIDNIFSNIDPNLTGEAKDAAYAKAQASCEKSLAGNPKAKEICSKFQKISKLKTTLNIITEKELFFTRKTGKDPYNYLRYVANTKNGPTAINGARFISQDNGDSNNNKPIKEVDDQLKAYRIDPDVYKTKKLLELKKDRRTNVTNLSGEEDNDQTQRPEFKVADAVFYVGGDQKGITFPVNVKVPCIVADTIYVSDQNLGDKPIHLRLTADVFNPKNNKIIAHKGSLLSGKASSLDMDTKTLTVNFSKISDGPVSDDIQLSVSIRGEAWDTKGKQITGAVLVDYATSILDKITSDSKSSLSSTDQALLDVVNQSSVTAATSAVQKIAQQLATDLQNAKKLFFAPEGAKVIIYP